MTTPLTPLAVNDAPPPPPLHANVQRIVAAIFGISPDDVAGNADLVKDLGATSLESVELVMAIEEAFDIEISDGEAAKVVTIDDLERLIRARKTEAAARKNH
jgi:acyl carrier protein